MQSGQDTLDTPTHRNPPSRAPSNEVPRPPYTPRTVWQTPHGLAPTLTRQRTSRNTDISKIMRRSLRLVYRLRRVTEGPDNHPGLLADGLLHDSLSLNLARKST